MRSFAPGFLDALPIPQRVLRTVRVIGEFRGKEDLFKRQTPQVLETLRQVAIIQSTESSNRIEGITAPRPRIEALVAQKTTPRNRSEQEIAGYRDVLQTIHANHAHMNPTSNLVLQLHRDLYRFLPAECGRWKSGDNEITETHPDGTRVVRFHPVPAWQTPRAMECLHAGLRDAWKRDEVERLVLVAAYVLDFLCIHPFLDGKGPELGLARTLRVPRELHAGKGGRRRPVSIHSAGGRSGSPRPPRPGSGHSAPGAGVGAR